MSQLAVSFTPGTPGEGTIYEIGAAGTLVTKKEVLSGMDRRTQPISYRGSTHLIGTFQRPWVRDRFGAYHLSGIRQPLTKPVLADGAFSAGSTGNMIGYQTFLMKAGNIKLAESNPGPPSAILAAAGTGRAWSNLDWTPQDSHVTHSRGYVSVDGELPALAWEIPLASGSAAVKESVLSASLGETLPVRFDARGEPYPDLYARGIPPYTQFAEVYHDAVFYAGDPLNPERIYYSRLYEPEAVNTTPITVLGRTELPWLSTTDGAPVTGIKRQGDELVVGTYRGIDVIQGYFYGDYTIRRVSNYWGVLSHFSMKRVGPLGSLFFAAPQGPTLYNTGSFRFIGRPIQTWWRAQYKANPALFEQSYGTEDRHWHIYKLLIPQSDGSSLYLCVDYISAELGRPIWVFDKRARKDWVSEELETSPSSSLYDLYTGSCDGAIRKENDDSDVDDDGDTYLKRLTVQTPHHFRGSDQGGQESGGASFQAVDLFLKHPSNTVTMSLYGGDDNAPDATTPQLARTLPATGAAAGERERVPATSQQESAVQVPGKGVTLLIEVDSPDAVEFRGWGLEMLKGPQSEPYA